MAKNKAVFLDRDGTLNEEMGYINHISRLIVFDNVKRSIQLLKDNGYVVVVISNQSGLARGYFDENLLNRVNAKLIESVSEKGVGIDKIYYCPHHINGTVKQYAINCNCRKPKPGMLHEAQKDFDIDLTQSYMIGDRYNDMVFAKNHGLMSVMVMTGYGRGEFTHQQYLWDFKPDFICDTILEASELIVKNEP